MATPPATCDHAFRVASRNPDNWEYPAPAARSPSRDPSPDHAPHSRHSSPSYADTRPDIPDDAIIQRMTEHADRSRSDSSGPIPSRDPDAPSHAVEEVPSRPFDPSPEIAARILDEIARSDSSLTAIARAYGATIDAFTLWLATPEITARCAAILRGGAMQCRMAVTSHLNTAVAALEQMISTYTRIEHALPLRYNDISMRTREFQRSNARKSINTFIRLGRYNPFAPLNPDDMNRPARTLSDRSDTPVPVPVPRAVPSKSASDFDAPSEHDAAVPDRGATASARTCSSDSAPPSRVACPVEEQACTSSSGAAPSDLGAEGLSRRDSATSSPAPSSNPSPSVALRDLRGEPAPSHDTAPPSPPAPPPRTTPPSRAAGTAQTQTPAGRATRRTPASPQAPPADAIATA